MNALVVAFAQTLHMAITVYIWVIIIAALLSFVQPNPYNPIVQALHRLTEPLFAWVRRTFPFVVFSGIDLSPLLVIFALQFIDIFMMRLLLG